MQPADFALSEQQRQVEHLIAYSDSLSAEPWSYSGDVVVTKGSKSVVGPGTASWSEHRGECSVSGNAAVAAALQSGGKYGSVMPKEEFTRISGVDGSWASSEGHLTSVKPGGTDECAVLRMFGIETGDTNIATTSHGIVLGGVEFNVYPMGFPTHGGRGYIVDGLMTKIFGRTTLVRRMPSRTDAGFDVLVAFDGDALTMVEQHALLLVFSFLAGRTGAVCANIGLYGPREVWRKSYAWNPVPIRARSPAPFLPWIGESGGLTQQLPLMLDAALRLLNEDVRIDVALSHLFADSHNHLDVEIRDTILALDALVESRVFAPTDKHIMPPETYDDVLALLQPVVDEILDREGCVPELKTRIAERLKGANDVAHAERRRRFWKRVGFEIKSDETKALKIRHPMSHQGYVLRGTGDQGLQLLLTQTRLARTLVNRAILALLGYDGPVFDYTDGLMHPWQYYIERDPSQDTKP